MIGRDRWASRAGLALAGAGAMAGLSGCVRKATGAAEATFGYEAWVPLAVLAGSALATGVGWYGRKFNRRFGWSFVILGPLAAAFGVPSLAMDRVAVDDEGFRVETGFWAAQDRFDVKFADLKAIRITSRETRTLFGSKQVEEQLACDGKAGRSLDVPINRLVAEAAETIFARASKLGVRVVDKRKE